ncbi:MAG: GNAT family protein [Bryobacteraceae bacterium]
MRIVRVERGFPSFAVPRVWAWTESFKDRIRDDFSAETIEQFLEQWETAEAGGRVSWSVLRDGELGGVIQSRPSSPIVADINFVFKPSFWGQATTKPAMEAVLAEIYATGFLKVTSSAYRDNAGVIGLLKNLGGKTEAVLEGHTVRGGSLVDVVIISLTKDRFNGGRAQQLQKERGARVATPPGYRLVQNPS